MENNTLCHEAIVKEVNADTIVVQMQVESACTACHSRHLCGMTENKQQELTVKNEYHESFEVGERVQVKIQNSLAWKAILICYLFPFVVLIASFITLSVLIENELISALVSLGAVGVYYFIVWLFREKIDHNTHFMISKLSQE